MSSDLQKITEKQQRLANPRTSGGTRRCRICEEQLPLTEEFWHRDSHDPEGFQAACKECRKIEAQATENRRILDQVRVLDETIVEAVARAADDGRQRGSLVPHAASLYERLIAAFGGELAFAQHYAMTYAAAKPGSAIREKLLRQIVNLGTKVSEMGRAEEDLDALSTADLMARGREMVLRLAPPGSDAKPAGEERADAAEAS